MGGVGIFTLIVEHVLLHQFGLRLVGVQHLLIVTVVSVEDIAVHNMLIVRNKV